MQRFQLKPLELARVLENLEKKYTNTVEYTEENL